VHGSVHCLFPAAGDGTYKPFHFQTTLVAADVEISDDMFVITRETAEAYLANPRSPESVQPGRGTDTPYPPGAGPTITSSRSSKTARASAIRVRR
jgi:hypothetical protein